MIKFRFISLNSEGFLIQQKGPMVRFINYFSVVENMFSHYTGLIRGCVELNHGHKASKELIIFN